MSRGTRVAATLTALALAGLAGCGSAETPSAADDVPSLRVALSRVDDAMAAHRYTAAEKLLRQLIAEVRSSRDDGNLDAATASDIADAARRLLAVLADPDETPATEAPTSTPTEDTPTEGPSSRPTRTPADEPTAPPSSGPTTGPPTSDPPDPPTPSSPPPSSDTDPSAEKTQPAGDPATSP